MTDTEIRDLLERAAGRASVGAPPIAEMLGRVSKERQRLRASIAVGLVVALMGGVAVGDVALRSNGTSDDPSPARIATSGVTNTAIPFPAPANASLAVGQTAMLRIFLSCGLRYAMIEGTTWETTPLGEGSAPPGYPDLLVGEATRISDNVVLFKSSTPIPVSWTFHPSMDARGNVCF